MAINELAAVQAEYDAKSAAVTAYDPAALDDDLAKLEVLAAFVTDVARLAAMLDVAGGATTIGNRSAGLNAAAAMLTNAVGQARAAVTQAQLALTPAEVPEV